MFLSLIPMPSKERRDERQLPPRDNTGELVRPQAARYDDASLSTASTAKPYSIFAKPIIAPADWKNDRELWPVVPGPVREQEWAPPTQIGFRPGEHEIPKDSPDPMRNGRHSLTFTNPH